LTSQADAKKDQVGKEQDNADDQQVQQSLDYRTDNAQGYRGDNQQQE
jgi:hypothetical protein